MDRRGNLKQGTHLIFNVSPDFELHGEGAPHLTATQLCLARPGIVLVRHDTCVVFLTTLQTVSSVLCVQMGSSLPPQMRAISQLFDTHRC